jgi:uncharacterized membrane protein
VTGSSSSGGRLEHRIARILSVGSAAAIVLLVVGTGLLLASGGSPLDASWPPFEPGSLPADLLALEPAGFLYLGLIVAIATPLLRVGVALIAFARAGDARMALVSVGVLVVVAVAIAVAGPLGG